MKVIESWESAYSGFTPREGAMDWLMKMAEKYLPAPEMSATCKQDGHLWQELPSQYATNSLYGCRRCAKRGLVVFRTDGEVAA